MEYKKLIQGELESILVDQEVIVHTKTLSCHLQYVLPFVIPQAPYSVLIRVNAMQTTVPTFSP